jgi:hypothetical protein
LPKRRRDPFEEAQAMLRFAARAERAWSVVPAAGRLALVVLVVIALVAITAMPALAAAGGTNPFRWT